MDCSQSHPPWITSLRAMTDSWQCHDGHLAEPWWIPGRDMIFVYRPRGHIFFITKVKVKIRSNFFVVDKTEISKVVSVSCTQKKIFVNHWISVFLGVAVLRLAQFQLEAGQNNNFWKVILGQKLRIHCIVPCFLTPWTGRPTAGTDNFET